jgi:nitrate/nitrite transporter NarK
MHLLAMCGVFAVQLIYLLPATSYPPRCKGSALGFCSACARLGGLVAPPAAGLLPLNVTLAAFGGLMAVAAAIVASLAPLGVLRLDEAAAPTRPATAEISNSASTAFVLHDTVLERRDEEEDGAGLLCMCGAGASLSLTSHPRFAL